MNTNKNNKQLQLRKVIDLKFIKNSKIEGIRDFIQ